MDVHTAYEESTEPVLQSPFLGTVYALHSHKWSDIYSQTYTCDNSSSDAGEVDTQELLHELTCEDFVVTENDHNEAVRSADTDSKERNPSCANTEGTKLSRNYENRVHSTIPVSEPIRSHTI